MDLNEAIYKIRSKEKMIKPVFQAETGKSKTDLEKEIAAALSTTKKELQHQAKEGYFTTKEAKDIHSALSQMPVLKDLPTGEIVAVFPEFKANEFYIHAI